MPRDLPDADALVRALQQKGWQPARADAEPLFALVATGDKDAAEAASRALARLGEAAALAAIARFDAAAPVARARLVRLVGRVAQARPGSEPRAFAQFLLARVADPDEKTARNAALALGRLDERVPAAEVERALVARWPTASPALRRALAEALGKRGGADALAVLDEARGDDDAELARVTHEARVKIRRTLGREQPGAIADDVAPAAPLPVLAHCRHGLATLLAQELAAAVPSCGARVVDDETVALTLRAPLSALWGARTMLRFGFPLPARGSDVARRRRRRARLRRRVGDRVALHPRHRALSARVGRRRPPPRAHLPRRRRRRRPPAAAGQRLRPRRCGRSRCANRARAPPSSCGRARSPTRASPIASPTSRPRRTRPWPPRSPASPVRAPTTSSGIRSSAPAPSWSSAPASVPLARSLAATPTTTPSRARATTSPPPAWAPSWPAPTRAASRRPRRRR